MLDSEDNCLEHILQEISAEATTLRSVQAKLDEQRRLFTDLAVASRLKVESRTAGTYRNWPIECKLKVVPVAGDSQCVLVGLKNKLHVALDRWKLLLNVRPLVLFVGHSADSESCRNKCYSSSIPFLAGGAECRHEFRIDDPFEGTAIVFDLFLLKQFDHSVFKVQISSHVIHLFDLIIGQQNTGCASRLVLEQFRCFQCLSARTVPLGKLPTLATCSISFGQHLVRSKRSSGTYAIR
ncbi:hypothetical protein M513_10153 [Trichuris suis]|uniref:Uncharacterized protein n=1 Tax=Trichuris suis TaxID=68888 RepID=A0A085LVK5_9BILA|nr:hypothetical protein M513_10153 [Trichuris suis]